MFEQAFKNIDHVHRTPFEILDEIAALDRESAGAFGTVRELL